MEPPTHLIQKNGISNEMIDYFLDFFVSSTFIYQTS